MRGVRREDLPQNVLSYLTKRQAAADKAAVDGSLEIEKVWKSARKTVNIGLALAALRRMMGPRERCMYCVDSHGSDIDHFRPKGTYPESTFLWTNMLLCCTECGRIKGDRFPLSPDGEPLLVDPSTEDPWQFLDFDPDTGNLTARYDVDLSAWSDKGRQTVDLLRLDRREAMAASYRKSYKRLRAVVQQAVEEGIPDLSAFLDALQAADDHHLLDWCFGSIGGRVGPFLQLREAYPETWRSIAAILADADSRP
jgi:uncharacterized protein (TIGR02646 family)